MKFWCVLEFMKTPHFCVGVDFMAKKRGYASDPIQKLKGKSGMILRNRIIVRLIRVFRLITSEREDNFWKQYHFMILQRKQRNGNSEF